MIYICFTSLLWKTEAAIFLKMSVKIKTDNVCKIPTTYLVMVLRPWVLLHKDCSIVSPFLY